MAIENYFDDDTMLMDEFLDDEKDRRRLVYIPVDKIYPHPDNPRKDIGDVTELADSMIENGIMQNLTVVKNINDTKSYNRLLNSFAAHGVLLCSAEVLPRSATRKAQRMTITVRAPALMRSALPYRRMHTFLTRISSISHLTATRFISSAKRTLLTMKSGSPTNKSGKENACAVMRLRRLQGPHTSFAVNSSKVFRKRLPQGSRRS